MLGSRGEARRRHIRLLHRRQEQEQLGYLYWRGLKWYRY